MRPEPWGPERLVRPGPGGGGAEEAGGGGRASSRQVTGLQEGPHLSTAQLAVVSTSLGSPARKHLYLLVTQPLLKVTFRVLFFYALFKSKDLN